LAVIAANKSAADDLAYSAVESVIIGLHRFDLLQFANEITRNRLAALGFVRGDLAALEALCSSVAFEAAQSGELELLQNVVRMPRFAKALCRTLTELRLEGITARELTNAGALDLAALLRRYRAALEEWKIADLATILQTAADIVDAGLDPFSGCSLLLLSPSMRNRGERQLLRSLAVRAPALLALGTLQDGPNFETVTGVHPQTLSVPPASCAASVQAHLFSPSPVPRLEQDGTFELFSAAGEALECVEIARRAQVLARKGVPFDSMAVLLRSPATYQPVLEEAFFRAGIPAWFSEGVRLPHRAGRAVLTLLEFAQSDFAAARFGEYMSLAQVPSHATGNSRDLGMWERIVLEANVIGGRDRWFARLHSAREALENALAKAHDDDARQRAGHRLQALDALSGFVLPLIDVLAAHPAGASWNEWLVWLRQVAAAGIRDNGLIEPLLDSLMPLARTGPVTLQHVLQMVGEHLRNVREPAAGHRYGRVFVGEPADAEGMSFEVVFIPALSEGTFPRPLIEDPLLLNEARRRAACHLRITTEEDERHHLRIAVAAASSIIIGSFPRMDLLAGRARVPSLYVFELSAAAGLNIADLKHIEAAARNAVSTRAAWPAPRHTADAIDDAEFDLARLRPVLEGKYPDGIAAYLKLCSTPLDRSLRDRYLRWNEPSWNFRDGYIEQQIASSRPLAEHALTARPYSASALEDYASCPYRFYLRYIVGLKPAPSAQPSWRMDPLQRGRLFHRAAALFVQAQPASLDLKAKLDLMDTILSEVAAEFEEELAIQVPLAWKAELESLRTDLRGLIREMEREPDWAPVAAELAFGLGDDAPEPIELPGLVRLRGAIDRVDQHEHNQLRVVDYKTGAYLKADRPIVVHGGEVLQPLLYSMAAARFFNAPVRGGTLLYATVKGRYRSHSIELSPANEEALRTCLGHINSAILNGQLPAAPVAEACTGCDYRRVCGPYEQERQHRKKDKLAALDEMRRMP
jgi:RecB family exonuclease